MYLIFTYMYMCHFQLHVWYVQCVPSTVLTVYCLCFPRLLSQDEADTGPTGIAKQLTSANIRSIHPNSLVRIMKKGNELMENEEELLEDKGGFLRQAWTALKFLKDKVSTDQTV